jgi:hypothetical protein
MVEVRPTNWSVVHRAVVVVREPDSKWLRGEIESGKPWTAPPRRRAQETFGGGSDILTIYTPGMVIFKMHYTTNVKDEVNDRTRIGFVFAKEPPPERVLTLGAVNTMFEIPPGASDYRSMPSPHISKRRSCSASSRTCTFAG